MVAGAPFNFRKGENPMRRQILLASAGAIAIAGSAFAAISLTASRRRAGLRIGLLLEERKAARASIRQPIWPPT
jgi:hypothetical protein